MADRTKVFPPHDPSRYKDPEAGLARPSPTTRRDAMGADMVKRQTLTLDGAVEGAGGYVYKPMPDGSVTILNDPSGNATGVNLTTGEAYDAIVAELKAKGVPVSGAAPQPPPVLPEAAPIDLGESDPSAPDSASGSRLGFMSAEDPADVVLGPQSPRDLRDSMGSQIAGGGADVAAEDIKFEGAKSDDEIAQDIKFEPVTDDDIAEGVKFEGAPPKPGANDTAFTAPVAENDRATGPGDSALASAALALPTSDPRRPAALEAALRKFVRA